MRGPKRIKIAKIQKNVSLQIKGRRGNLQNLSKQEMQEKI